jgi:hypothetical protein
MLRRLGYYFDTPTRIYVTKALVFPIINLYDFIYSVASSLHLRRLDTAYNDLMRVILGVRKSQHVRLTDMYRLTSFDELSIRRQQSHLKFMMNVKNETVFSRLRMCFITACHSYPTRSRELYKIQHCNTKFGQDRISVRGLQLLNMHTMTRSNNCNGTSQ